MIKRLLLCLAVSAKLFALNPCAEHNINLSSTATTISTSGAALCTATTTGGVTYTCSSTSGGIGAWGFDIITPCVTNYVTYAIFAADTSTGAGHTYDIGLYCVKGPCALANNSLAGSLYVHTGKIDATAFTPTGTYPGLLATALAWTTTAVCTSMPCTLPAGQYALAIGSDCSTTCAQLYGDDNKGYMYLFDIWLGGQNGVLNANTSLQPSGCTSGTCSYNFSTNPGLPAAITPPVTDPAFYAAGTPRPPAVLIF